MQPKASTVWLIRLIHPRRHAIRSDPRLRHLVIAASRGPFRRFVSRTRYRILRAGRTLAYIPAGETQSLQVGRHDILHVLYAEEQKTLPRVASFLSDPKRSIRTHATRNDGDQPSGCGAGTGRAPRCRIGCPRSAERERERAVRRGCRSPCHFSVFIAIQPSQ